MSGWCDYDYDYDGGSYKKLDAAPSTPGEHYAEITGVGKYHGSRLINLDILDRYDLNSYGV